MDRTQRPSAALVQAAAYGLLHTHPELSAGQGLRPPPALILGPLIYALGLSWIAPGWIMNGIAVLGLACVIAASGVKLWATLMPVHYAPRRPLNERSLPALSLIVALHDEADVVADLMTSLKSLDYPSHKLDIILVLEAHDHATRLACQPMMASGVRVLVLPPLGPMTKPRALNAALGIARGALIAVYDAEDTPHPDQLKAAAESFAADPDLGVVQAPLGWYNRKENWLTEQFALEYAAQFHVLLPFYQRLGWPLPLGGTSNVFRRSALEQVGGWDPFNVTEDADLGFRLARSGWKAGLIEPPTLEEAPIQVKAWINQRSRWLKGHGITWLVHMRNPRALLETAGWQALASLQLTLLANVLSASLHAAIMLGVGVSLVISISLNLPVSFGFWMIVPAYAAAMLCAGIGARRAGFKPEWHQIISMPLYWMLQTPAALKALRELPRQPYLWRKTQHGVSTAQRIPPDVTDHHDRPDARDRLSIRPGRLAWRTTLKPGQAPSGALDTDRHR